MVLVISAYRTAQPLLRTFSIGNAVSAATAVIKLVFLVVWRQLCLLSPLQFIPAHLSILLQVAGLCWGAPAVPLTVCVSLLFSCMISLLPPVHYQHYSVTYLSFSIPWAVVASEYCTANPCCNWFREFDILGTSWAQSSVCCFIRLCGAQTPGLFNALIPKNNQQNFSHCLYVCFRWVQGSDAKFPEWARPNKPVVTVTPCTGSCWLFCTVTAVSIIALKYSIDDRRHFMFHLVSICVELFTHMLQYHWTPVL